MSRQSIKRCSGLVATAVGLALAAGALGCAGRHASAPAPSGGSFHIAKSITPFVARRVPLISTPMDVRNDYVYPMPGMRQKLIWQDGVGSWELKFPPKGYAYGGVQLKRKVNMALSREATRLTFRLKPARAAEHLTVALVDQPSNTTCAITDYQLRNTGSFNGEGWVTIEIALTNFPTVAHPLTTSWDTAAMDPALASPRLFDWQGIREVRIVSHTGPRSDQPVLIKNLSLQR
jgi:hypothetical protein